MRIKQSITQLAVFVIGLSAWSCVEQKPVPATMTVCDEHGCAERPKNYATFDPSATPEAIEDQKIKALETMAGSDPRAAYDLGLRFFRGDGVKQNGYLGVKWMRTAAEAGDFNAQKALGRLYLTGLGEMGSDPGEAEKWLSITASKGDREANKLLKEAVIARQAGQAAYQVNEQWRKDTYYSWAIGYRYYWGWRTTGWYLY